MPAIRKAEVAPSSSSNIVNGINVTDLFALIGASRRTPQQPRQTGASPRPGRARPTADRGRRVPDRRQGCPRRFSFDIDEPYEFGGGNRFANPQEHLIAALNACMTVGTSRNARCAGSPSKSWRSRPKARSISAASSASIPRGERLREPALHRPHQGRGSKEQFAEVHHAVMATSPNFYNVIAAAWPSNRPSSSSDRRSGSEAAADRRPPRRSRRRAAWASHGRGRTSNRKI